MRLRILESLWGRPQSAKEIAVWAGLPADRLYYHLAQLEETKLIEVAEYRRLPGGKVERVYRPTPVEPPGDEATPLEIADFLGAALEATRADIVAASVAQEAGEQRNITLTRTTLRLSETTLVTFRERLLDLVRQAQEQSDEGGVWTRVVISLIDLQNRASTTSEGELGAPDT
ncbi:MAG TPA: winged helix-turn-helix domain-containing protein [Ktedonobacteraceae bacterium]|jgi:DNA-binding transcriptional ArsR family regulator